MSEFDYKWRRMSRAAKSGEPVLLRMPLPLDRQTKNYPSYLVLVAWYDDGEGDWDGKTTDPFHPNMTIIPKDSKWNPRLFRPDDVGWWHTDTSGNHEQVYGRPTGWLPLPK